MKKSFKFSATLFVLTMGLTQSPYGAYAADAKAADEMPTFRYDPEWPKQLPNAWMTGNIGAMAIDKNDRIWVAQRPASTTGLSERDALTGAGDCCAPAPPVLVFDQQGNLLKAWGDIHTMDDKTKKQMLIGKQVSNPYPEGLWPSSEHSIFVDHEDNVWLSNNAPPSQILKFTNDGKFLLRIGKQQATSSNDKENLAGPAGIHVDAEANEIFIADGYQNRRVVVFDAKTGAYKRHWGAYGKIPPDGPQQPVGMMAPNTDLKKQNEQFATVHCIAGSKDGLLYVCDRANSRVQVFRKNGTYVSEVFLEPKNVGIGTTFAIAFSADPQQKYLYVGDGSDKKVFILRRSDLKVLGTFGTAGREGGRFMLIHAMVTDSKGNLYVGETIDNNRVQRFNFTGMKPVSAK